MAPSSTYEQIFWPPYFYHKFLFTIQYSMTRDAQCQEICNKDAKSHPWWACCLLGQKLGLQPSNLNSREGNVKTTTSYLFSACSECGKKLYIYTFCKLSQAQYILPTRRLKPIKDSWHCLFYNYYVFLALTIIPRWFIQLNSDQDFIYIYICTYLYIYVYLFNDDTTVPYTVAHFRRFFTVLEYSPIGIKFSPTTAPSTLYTVKKKNFENFQNFFSFESFSKHK